MGVINRTTDEINTLLDKIANLPEEGTSGKDGKTPVLETGTTTTLEAGSQATSEVVRNGEDASGNPKYKINFGIPRGQDGTSEGGGGVADSVDWSKVQNKPTWVDSATKPTYTASEVGALPSTTSIPTKTSELENDSNFTTTSSFKTINGNSILGEGNLEISSGGGGVADSVEWNKVLNKPQWVISDTKPTYTASEVGAIATGSLKTINGQSLEGKGNIEISGSGSDSAVDITEYFTKLSSLGEEETLPLEDYNVLKGYADNNTPVKISDTPYMKNLSTTLISSDGGIFWNSIVIMMGTSYGAFTFAIQSNGSVKREFGEFANFFKLGGYQKASSYTAITSGDTIQSAIQKLEAGIGQGGSGGGSDVYILPQELYTLTSESTSEQISTAIGGDEGFNNIVAGIKAYKRFYFNVNEELICEVAMTYFSAGENNKAIVMRVSSYGAFNQYAGIISVGIITKENSTYTFEALALQSQA